MKFKSDPGMVIRDSKAKTIRVIGVFDKDGIFETSDPDYMRRLKAAGFEVVDEAPEKEQPTGEATFVCSTCNIPFATQGERLAHYKSAEHKAKKAEQEQKK